MKKTVYTIGLIPSLMLCAGLLLADGEAAAIQQQAALKAEQQSMLEEAERARAEAEAARREAVRAAEKAREIARQQERAMREDSSLSRQAREEQEKAREMQREEMARAREELSRAHRELREASREVARAHNDLSHTGQEYEITTEINTGDRAVIGVVLGNATGRGVKIIAVSPDGPAERAGIEPGDVLLSIRGQDLANPDQARQAVFSAMQDVGDGEELALVVDRDGQALELTVTAERREPRGWQSVIRIPEIPVTPESPEAPHVVIEHMVVPEIDEQALAAEIEELTQRIEASQHMFISKDGDNIEEFKFEFDDFSELGELGMSEANIWFSLPQAHGLELTAINEGLGSYFKTDRGVLVIRAKEGNAYELKSGDVILTISAIDVNTPSDLVRALRDVDPGSEISIEIKRDRKNKTLKVVVPENRLGYR